jgi:hypothetical protein
MRWSSTIWSKAGTWAIAWQELIFISEERDIECIDAVLDACLLTDGEWAEYLDIMLKDAGAETGGVRSQGESMQAQKKS